MSLSTQTMACGDEVASAFLRPEWAADCAGLFAHGIGAQIRDTVDPACIKARQQRGRRQARIDAHLGHVAEGPPSPGP
jgi:hypothetical protein